MSHESQSFQDSEAIAVAKQELAYYDKHPTSIEELFIPQWVLRMLVQMAEKTKQTDLS